MILSANCVTIRAAYRNAFQGAKTEGPLTVTVGVVWMQAQALRTTSLPRFCNSLRRGPVLARAVTSLSPSTARAWGSHVLLGFLAVIVVRMHSEAASACRSRSGSSWWLGSCEVRPQGRRRRLLKKTAQTPKVPWKSWFEPLCAIGDKELGEASGD